MKCSLRYPALPALVTILCCGISLPACASDLSGPPRSPEAQVIVERVEEILHVHPERTETRISLLERVLKDYPGTHQAALALACLSYGNEALGNADAAVQFRDQLGRDFPGSLALGELLLLSAEKAEARGDDEQARSGYAQAIAVLDKHLDVQEGQLMRYTAGRCLAQVLEREFGLAAEAFAVGKETADRFPGASGQTSAWRFMADFASAHGGEDGVPTLESMGRGDLADLDAGSRVAAILGAARLYFEQGDYARSAEALNTAATAYPDTPHMPDVLLHRARLMAALQPQQIEGRLAAWQSVIDRYPNDPRCATAYVERANLFRKLGQYDKAVAERQAGRDNAALIPVARGYMCVVLGDIYRQDLGAHEKAIAAYQEARRLGAGTPAAWSAVRRLEAMGVNAWPEL